MKGVESDLKKFVVHVQLDWETCTLEDVDKLHDGIIRRFHLPSFSINLKELLEVDSSEFLPSLDEFSGKSSCRIINRLTIHIRF